MSGMIRHLRRTALFMAGSAFVGLALTAAPTTATAAAAPRTTTTQVPTFRELPEPPDAVKARELLADLVIADEDDVPGYSRAKFPHWITQSGTCETREVVLQRDGQGVVQDDQCRATSGTWYSEYDGKTVESASGIDIDHVVPLKEAWRSGASEWSTPERRAFANDLTDSQLIAVSAASNRSKGDKDPGSWKPPLQSYHCTYSRAWISVKATYQLTANPAEAAALAEMLDTCAT
ncbi:HNH endonuclease family protein [Streptomyces sp. NBC_00378]|uniref:HNH endonuclease family protein n=1 Tax=unclassified Streptomyces TaxID=2593676 RepID=UPI0022549ABF|nr:MULTISPECIES: HNH endonuclease family protein [unclassified Streptomyces]MCX5115280.1 HNH endonuclease family protein [Streptomyces sp. NBC_00378]